MLPLYIKDTLARILFENLQVSFSPLREARSCISGPKVISVSFASSHLLSLLSVGRLTGLVVDCGYLESTALPVRPIDSIDLSSSP
jgi:actin-related protein 10